MNTKSSGARRLVRAAAILVAAGALGLAVLVWNFDRPPFDMAKLDQMRVGQLETDVEALLGAPGSRYEKTWAYSRFLSWPIVYVEFDDNRRVRSWRYDF